MPATILPINTHKSIGVTSTLVDTILRDQKPKLIALSNTSTNYISVSILNTTGSAVLYDGVTISPGGAFTYDISSLQDRDIYIYGIASGASSNLGVTILN